MILDIEQIETDLAAGRADYRTVRQLIEEVKRLRAEVERLQHQAIGLSESASKSLILYANAGTEADGLRAEVERLQEEIERLQVEGTSPKPGPSINSLRPAQDAAGRGFLTWLNQVADLLPVGTVIGVSIEELGRWFEDGVSVEAAGEAVRGEGP